jgi:hypothetical protein
MHTKKHTSSVIMKYYPTISFFITMFQLTHRRPCRNEAASMFSAAVGEHELLVGGTDAVHGGCGP